MAKYLWWVLAGALVAASAQASGGALYLLNEGSGTVAIDASGAGNNGTVNGAGYIPGYEGTALSFSKYAAVLVPPSIFQGFGDTASFTAWVYPTAYPPPPYGCDATIFRKRADSNDWVVSLIGQGELNCSFPGASGHGGVVSRYTWSKVACWYDQTGMHAAINDIEVASNPARITLDWQGAYLRTEIGNDTYDTGSNCGDYSFHGAIDRVAITSLLAPVRASFTWTPSAPTAGQQVRFTDTSTGSPTTWSWHFGDGSTSSAQNPTHAYVSAGTYTVTQTVTAYGVSNTTSHAVNIYLPAGCVTPIQQLPIMQSAPFSSSCVSQDLQGHLAKFFTFQVQTPTLFAARLSIPSIDAHLSLLAGNTEFGRVLATDEHSGGGYYGPKSPPIAYSARLSRNLAPGTYTLEVTTAALVPTTAAYNVQAYVARSFDEKFTGSFNASWTRSGDPNTCSPLPCIPPNGGTKFDQAKVVSASGVVTLLLQNNQGAQMVSNYDDFHYGTYYFLAAIPDTRNLIVPQGSVFGLFTFQRNSLFANSEIDFEFLTRWALAPAGGFVFFTAHKETANPFALGSVVPQAVLGQKVWYVFEWKPTSVNFYAFANNNGSIGQQLATATIGTSPTDEGKIIINLWAGNTVYGGAFPSSPVIGKLYEVHFYPGFFPSVDAAQ